MAMVAIISSLVSTWQIGSLSCILIWLWASSKLNLTQKLRSFARPWVARRVLSDTHLTLLLQSKHCGFFDHFFSALSCIVSIPFYTGFLPLLFWSGHSKLGRQMTLLIAFADYVGNSLKDLVSAPRPSCPPVRRIIVTADEQENAMEYGLPSSHALNTVCLSGYLLHYYLSCSDQKEDSTQILVGLTVVFMLVILIGLGRIYLGMHSLIDVISGVCIGVIILVIWLAADSYVDDFIVYGQNVTFFWAVLSVLLCFAYPKPELLTPSFDYHSAFSGVALGIVAGIQQTYHHHHHEKAPRIFTPQLPLPAFIARVLVGIPTILAVKMCGKTIAKFMLPRICNALGIAVTSTCYVPALKGSLGRKNKSKGVCSRCFVQKPCDIDTGIRFLQYAGLAWSVVDLVPFLFDLLKL